MLSFGQERLWFLEQMTPGLPLYHIPHAFRLRGPLARRALERALNALVRRHEALRTRIAMSAGTPVQAVVPELTLGLAVEDLAREAGPGVDLEDEALVRAAREVRRPFDLGEAPLIRTRLLRLGDEDHLLVLTIHHMVADGWSLMVLTRELSACYRAARSGQEAALPGQPLQYADFAEAQRARLEGPALERQLAWWRQRLEGIPVLELPTDRMRSPHPALAGAIVRYTVPPAVLDAVKTLSRQEATTPFVVLLAAFGAVLSRYSGQTDVAVGTPVAGRLGRGVEGMVGLCVNTLVMRIDLSGQPTFRQLVRRVRDVAFAAYGQQEVPFEKLVEVLQPPRSLSHPPLFQVMFQLQPMLPPLDLPGVRSEHVELSTGTGKFDLDLALQETPGGLEGRIEYRTDLFDEETVHRLGGHYAMLLGAATRHSDLRLLAIPVLPEAEVLELARRNDTPAPYPRNRGLHDLVAEQAARTPDAQAVVQGDQRLTHGELDRRSNQLAHHLRTLGVGPEVVVGVWMPRSPALVTTLLGVLKAGGAYLPLDPEDPPRRLDALCCDAGVEVLVTVRGLDGRLSAPRTRVLVDGDAEEIARCSDQPAAVGVDPRGLAYVIYTSGSTGRPKGVAVSHQAVVNRLWWMQRYLRLAPGDSVLHKTPYTFDVSVWELFWPLMTGAVMVVAGAGMHRDPTALADLMVREQVSHVHFVPSMLEAFLAAIPVLPPVRHVVCSGEALSPALVQRFRRRSAARLHNLYGPTEAAIDVSSWEAPSGDPAPALVPIGRPIDNARLYVLDRWLRQVPVGVPGELFIGGDPVARGYLGQPALTAERFLPDPWSTAPGRRMYRTGDRARWRRDGTVEYLGRLDHQLKVRGLRIEPGEIESALVSHAGVREAVVVSDRDAGGDQRLVAYVAGAGQTPPDARELRSFLAQQLPAHMVPSVFVPLARLPLSSSGKVDRRALPAPGAPAGEQRGSAPRDELELRLAGIWEDLLGVRRVGVHDDFFELGGHSLMAVRLVTAVEKSFGQRIPLTAVFEHPTVEHLAAQLRSGVASGAVTPLVTLRTGGGGPPLFLVHPVGGGAACYVPLARRLPGGYPVHALQAPGIDGLGEQVTDLTGMAAHYVAAIRRVRPRGPYLLGGWSFGGVVAFEMAAQLAAGGDDVALVALVDSRAPGTNRPPRGTSSLELFADDLAAMAGRKGADLLDGKGGYDAMAGLTARAVEQGIVPPGTDPQVLRRMLAVYEANQRALGAYEPGRYPLSLTLLRAEQAFDGEDPSFGWERLAAGGVRRRMLPGNHYTLLREPHLGALAAALHEAVADAVGAGRVRGGRA